mgnify:CR=1 FL=1
MGSPRLKIEDVPRYEALIEAIKRAYKDVVRGRYRLRDLALVAILSFTGCRLGEALRLTISDLNFKARTIKIIQEKKRSSFTRIVPIPSRLFWEIMERYISKIPYSDMQLFEISDRQARNIVYKFTKRYLKRKIRPHALRHSYATFVLRKIRDLETVRRLLGHEDYSVLKAYLNYTQEDLENDLERIFIELE